MTIALPRKMYRIGSPWRKSAVQYSRLRNSLQCLGMYKPVRLSLRFVIPLLIAVGVFAYGALPLADRLMLRWFSRDLETRANLIANTIQDPLQDLIRTGNPRRIQEFFTRITQDERLVAVAFCPPENGEPVATTTLPKEVRCSDLDRFTEPGDLLQTAGVRCSYRCAPWSGARR